MYYKIPWTGLLINKLNAHFSGYYIVSGESLIFHSYNSLLGVCSNGSNFQGLLQLFIIMVPISSMRLNPNVLVTS